MYETNDSFRSDRVHCLRRRFSGGGEETRGSEFRRVIVTLKSGEKVEGYLKSGWHADGALLKKENYSFKITKTPDDKESVKYTADEVTCIDYAEKTEENPNGIPLGCARHRFALHR